MPAKGRGRGEAEKRRAGRELNAERENLTWPPEKP
jgi:hypothetical protein